MSLSKPSGLPKLSEVKLTRRTLVAGGAALVVAGAGVAVGVTRCSRGAADVPVEPTAGAEASEDGAAKLGGKLSLYTSCPEELVNAVVARFSQDAGVTVAVTRGSEAELVGQLLDGDVTGKPAADVIWGGEALWYAGVEGLSSGLEPVQREVGAFALAEGLADGKKGTPAAYAGLLATTLAGRVALCDPTSCEAGWLHLVAMLSEASGASAGGAPGDDVSWAFVQELLAAGAVICADEDAAVQALLDGSVDVALVSEQCARQLARRTGQTTVAWPSLPWAWPTPARARSGAASTSGRLRHSWSFSPGMTGSRLWLTRWQGRLPMTCRSRAEMTCLRTTTLRSRRPMPRWPPSSARRFLPRGRGSLLASGRRRPPRRMRRRTREKLGRRKPRREVLGVHASPRRSIVELSSHC